MDCFYPITVPRYSNVRCVTRTGNTIIRKQITGRIEVPCGRCPACRRRKQNEWAFRIMEEAKFHSKVAFVTLTYNDDNLTYSDSGIPTLVPFQCTTFLKNLRYDLEYYDKNDDRQSFRYFLCGEYGDQFDRPHYHMILFYNGDLSHEEIEKYVEKRWIHGFIKYEPGISPGRAKYCAKYSMKSIGYDYQDVVPPFARMSRRPGIGKQFLENIDVDLFRSRGQWFVHDQAGTPYSLPRYYRDRIYSSDECQEHSFLLSMTKGLKFDFEQVNRPDKRSIFKFESDKKKYREHLFIKSLLRENYGFKYKKYEPKPFRRNENSDIVGSEQDFESGPF